MALRLQQNDPRRQVQAQRVRFTIPPTETQRRGQNRTALSPIEPWEDGKLFHSIEEASQELTRVLGRGYSPKTIRERIKRGKAIESSTRSVLPGAWVQGIHYFVDGSTYKISVSRVVKEAKSKMINP